MDSLISTVEYETAETMIYYWRYMPWADIFSMPDQDVAVLNWYWMAGEGEAE